MLPVKTLRIPKQIVIHNKKISYFNAFIIFFIRRRFSGCLTIISNKTKLFNVNNIALFLILHDCKQQI